MLDVHAPEHPVHGVRDFLLHMLAITLGLLIALGLEAAVEAVHHGELRRQAESNLRQEIRDDNRRVEDIHVAKDGEMKQLLRLRDYIDLLAAKKSDKVTSLRFGFAGEDLSDASWKTAVSTGAVSYMDYAEVKRFASAYETQATYTRLQLETIDDMVGLQASLGFNSDPAKLSPQALEAARIQTDRALAAIAALDQVGAGLRQAYTAAL